MGAIEHFKTMCCLGLSPQAAMVAVTPVLHEIIPHGWVRMGLLEPDATIGADYPENPAAAAHFREHLWRFMNDPSALVSLWMPSFRAGAIGWSLPRQGAAYLQSAYYNEVERPLDSCWILDAMIGADGRTIGFVQLTRPRSARQFTLVELQSLDRLRPWFAHMFLGGRPGHGCARNDDVLATPAMPVASGQLVVTPDAKVLFQTPGVEFLLRILAGEPANYTRHMPARDHLPLPVLKLLRDIGGVAKGHSCRPPRVRLATPYGIVALDAKWLVVAADATDAARDPTGCHIGVTIELHEYALAHAARILREQGATPAQVKIGVKLALGKTKPMIAEELDIKASSVGDQTKKLYRCLDIHSAPELALKLWLVPVSEVAGWETSRSARDEGSRVVRLCDHTRPIGALERVSGSRR